MFTAIPPSCLPRCSSWIIYTRRRAQYHSLHRNTSIEKRQMVLTYLRVQSLHASSLQVCTHMFLQYYMLLYLPADDVNCIHLGPISVVTIVLMLMHVGCRTMKCGSTTCRNYDGTCDGGRILDNNNNNNNNNNILACRTGGRKLYLLPNLFDKKNI